MADLLFTNTASSLLATTISAVDTTIELDTGFGTRFPQPSVGTTWFYATLEDDQGNFEVVRVTDRSGDLLTVVRGQDNTTAQAFTQNVTRVELRLTAAVVEQFLQLSGGTMTDTLDLNGNTLLDAVIDGSLTQMIGGEIVNVPIRGLAGASGNEIAVPVDGTSRATVGGSDILAAGDDLIQYLDTAGVITFTSATTGVVIPDTGYLRVEGSTNAIYGELVVDADTDFQVNFAGLTDLVVAGLTGNVVLSNNLDLGVSDLLQANLLDFSIQSQTVAATATTALDYTAGSYVILNMNASISSFSITNPPTQYATMRLKVVQDGTGNRTITWPASYRWPNGVEPPLSTGANAVDYVDLWTDNGGTNWYGSYGIDWS
jgi:hypothetical protein